MTESQQKRYKKNAIQEVDEKKIKDKENVQKQSR